MYGKYTCACAYILYNMYMDVAIGTHLNVSCMCTNDCMFSSGASKAAPPPVAVENIQTCLLYTSDAADE